jgi:HAD superfamily phosphoserine phosphatase-like hydrolase
MELKTSKKGYATIDFDNTIIHNDIGEATLAFMCEKRMIRDKDLLGQKYDEEEYHRKIIRRYYQLIKIDRKIEAYSLAAKTMSGYKKEEVRGIVRKVISSEGKKLTKRKLYGLTIAQGIRERLSVKKILKETDKKGIEIWIVSASSEEIVREAAKKYLKGIRTKIIGVKNEERKGIMTSKIIKPLTAYEGKVKNIKKYVSSKEKPVIAIGDSKNDLAMLEYAKTPLVIKGSGLEEIARKKGWKII